MEGKGEHMSLNQYIDHTYLKPFATEADIVQKCSEAKKYHFASVCVNPCNVPVAARELKGSDVHTCSVVGFPFGTHTTQVKVFEATQAIENGADEIDMVINVGKLVEGNEEFVKREVAALVEVCHSRGRILKVIIETCYLTEEQIGVMCRIVAETGADFIKTSTGYGSRGASYEDIALFKKYLKDAPVKMKASGGIRTAEEAKKYVEMGCARLGTSNGVGIMEGLEAADSY